MRRIRLLVFAVLLGAGFFVSSAHFKGAKVFAQAPSVLPQVDQILPYQNPYTYPYSGFSSYGSYPYAYPSAYSYGYTYPSAYSYGAAPFTPAQTPATYAAESSSSPGIPTPDDCYAWDTWCSYCTSNPSSDLCRTFPPAHRSGGSAPTSATPGVGSAGTGTAGASAASGPATSVGLRQLSGSNRGLTDANGMTLYTVTTDRPGVSNCTGQCPSVWPPLTIASGSPSGSSGVGGALGVITRPDGGMQVTYNGMPLYRYSRDRAPGDTNGQGVTDQWGTWAVAAP